MKGRIQLDTGWDNWDRNSPIGLNLSIEWAVQHDSRQPAKFWRIWEFSNRIGYCHHSSERVQRKLTSEDLMASIRLCSSLLEHRLSIFALSLSLSLSSGQVFMNYKGFFGPKILYCIPFPPSLKPLNLF